MITAEARSVEISSHKTKTFPHKSGKLSELTCPYPPITSLSTLGLSTKSKTRTSSKRNHRKYEVSNPSSSHFKNFGLELKPELIVWQRWEPGEEYTRNLTLKNVNVKTQKIRYKPPSSHFFSTLFPQVIVLSAGTSFTLPITFRPLDKEKYEDKIEFSTSNGDFFISLHALLPETNLHLPESIHFGLVAVQDNIELNFQIKNMSSEMSTSFSWDVPPPFTIIPQSGNLSPKSSCTLKASFSPKSAQVFHSCVVCIYGENKVKKMNMEGIGKYPHLCIECKDGNDGSVDIDFGQVNIYHEMEKYVVVHNLSSVKAAFKVNRLNNSLGLDNSFHCTIDGGCVPPMGNTQIPIKFQPKLAGQTSTGYFEVCAVGDISKSTLKCIGACLGPIVTISTSMISFGVVNPGCTVVRSFKITNASHCEAYYQILLDTEYGVFTADENNGNISASESHTIVLRFCPQHSINYYRKVVILVHDQEPLFLQLLGTSHDEINKPPLLKPSHIHRYQTHVSRGLTFIPPDILHQQYRDGKIVKDSDGCFNFSNEEESSSNVALNPMDEYFDDGHTTCVTHNPPHVSLDKISIFLGQVQFNKDKEVACHAIVKLTNHTRGNVTAVWVADQNQIFGVSSSSCDVPAMKSTDFRIHFKPTAPNQFYGTQLECYVFYKCQRDYRLVDETVVCPPWLLTLDVSAHTFTGNNETFIPEIELCTNKVSFPPVPPNQSSYRTILLEKKSTAPILYQYLQKSNDTFTVKPTQGLIRSRYNISTLRYVPCDANVYNGDVTLRVNANPTHDQVLGLIGSGEQPALLLSNDGELFFRPTCIGAKNEGKYHVQNIGRIPIHFKWVMKKEDALCLSVSPNEGTIQPNEIQYHSWSFQPTSVKKFVFKPSCLAWHEKPDALSVYDPSAAQRFILRVVGEGNQGDIKCEKSHVDFGCVIAGSQLSEGLVLFNDSQCDLQFKLHIEQFVNCQYGEEPKENEPIGLTLSKSEGVVSGRSKTYITASAHPYRRVLYTWALYYELLNAEGKSINSNSRILLCELSAEGVYPTLAVIDARSSGSGSSVGKTQLWRWFNVEHLNLCLDGDPDKMELIHSIKTRHSPARRPSVHTKSVLGFNFGAASVDSEPCYVSLMVKNMGCVATKWHFLFPKDLEIEMGYWAETGEFNEDELHELHIQDNQLFTVSPNNGVLDAGEEKVIVLSYKHDVAGTHRLPVLLKIENGREILLNFIGVTVEASRRYLHFPATEHTFAPIRIGGPDPPKQLYEMFNGGAMALIYEVNLAPLHDLQSSNYDHPILTCLNPRGEILPGTSADLEWIFSPLESKTYTVDIPINVVGGESALITFNGIGYDTRVMGSTMAIMDQHPEYNSVPSEQKVPVPGQLLFLSEERISFGNVPLFSRSRHIVFLNNKSIDRHFSYSWHAASDVVNDVLRIEPVHGYLKPGQSKMTKVTFYATGQPAFYDLDLICEVVDEIKMSNFKTELQAWEAEQERQSVEFVISEEDIVDTTDTHASSVSPRRNLENILNKNNSRLRLTESQLSTAQVDYKTFQTLPPIRFEDPVKLPSNRSRLLRHKADSDEWVQPQPPQPFIFHLGVTARTHGIAEFRSNFAEQSKNHFIDRTLQISCPVAIKSPSEQYSLTICDEEEKEIITSVMSNIIRGLLDDPTFQVAAKDAGSEPIPYFPQLAQEKELEEVEKTKEEGKETPHDEVSVKTPKKLMDEILKQSEESRPMSRDSNTTTASDSKSLALSCTHKQIQEQEIKRSPMFGGILEEILSSTISNIIDEALTGDVILTARPRVVALPPSRGQSASSSSSLSHKSGSSNSRRRRQHSKSSAKRGNSAKSQ